MRPRSTNRRPNAVMRVPLLLAAPVIGLTVLFSQQTGVVDFTAFYASGLEWRRSGEFYDPPDGVFPNLNLPHTAVLLVPLSWLPYGVSLALWQALNLACFFDIGRRLRFSAWVWIGAFVWIPTWLHMGQGQIGGVVAWLVVRAYLSPSGWWLGAAMVVKPFTVAAIIRREWGRLVRYSVVGLAAVSLGMAIAGLSSYREWVTLTRSHERHEIGLWYHNLSIWFWEARTEIPAWPVAAALCVVSGWALWRRADPWRLCLPLALLLSPVGWQYYGWILAPLTVGATWLSWTGLILVGLPQPVLPLGTAGLVILWGRACRDGLRSPPAAIPPLAERSPPPAAESR